ncbi:hypothetical protein [Blastococcus litoris]|uniref:hypothetical protein n=1 Tax=Blastococcus litoris TaxID=2171622 RepID=UPI000E307945|nr:hypothetical protein [Blastococcus litoris]
MPNTSHGRPPGTAGSPPADRDDDASPAAPAIPSFASLRAPRRRTAVDVLLPEAPPAQPEPTPAAGPRPAEYADLWLLGVRTARVFAGLPWRVASWSVRAPAACVGRLLGRPQQS